MHKIDTDGHINNKFVDENVANGQAGTVVDAAFLNAVQSELVAVVEGFGGTLDKTKTNQIATLLTAKFSSQQNSIKTYATNTAYAVGEYVESANMLYKVTTAVPTNNTTAPTSNSSFTKLNNIQLLDEDNMSSNSDTKAPTQQSVKIYTDNKSIKIYATNTAYAVGEYVESANILYKVNTAVPANNTTAPATNTSFTKLSSIKYDLIFNPGAAGVKTGTHSLDSGSFADYDFLKFSIECANQRGLLEVNANDFRTENKYPSAYEYNITNTQYYVLYIKFTSNTTFTVSSSNLTSTDGLFKIYGVKL